MTKKFAIGDKVRIVKSRRSWKEKYIGKIVVVEGYYNGGEEAVVVRNEDGTNNVYVWFDDEIELVEDKRKFAVGDKVRLAKRVVGNSLYRSVGEVGVVVSADGVHEDYGVLVDFEESSKFGFRDSWMCSDDLELIAPSVPSPKFNVGDNVKVNENTPHGNTGMISFLAPFECRPYVVMFNDCFLRRYNEDEMTLVVEPAPLAWKASTAKHIEQERIDEWVHNGIAEVRKSLARGVDHEEATLTYSSGDALVIVEAWDGDGTMHVTIYRKEATVDVEQA